MHLFISSVSDDPIVILKTISSIKPDRAILLITEKAREKGWNSAIKSIKEITNIEVSGLNIPENDASLQSVAIRVENKLHENAPAKITVDCTTGRGLFRVGLVDICRNYAESKSIDFSVCYNDGDTRTIRVIDKFGKNYSENPPVPIVVEFASIKQRLLLYGSDLSKKNTIFFDKGAVPENNKLLLKNSVALGKHLLTDFRTRMFFGDFMGKITSWAKRNNVKLSFTGNGEIAMETESVFRKQYFGNSPAAKFFEEKTKFTQTFEDVVSSSVTNLILNDKELLDKVEAVAGGVEILQEGRKKIEIDTLILLKTGDIIALETKTAFALKGLSSQKDLESRIKNIRDLTGAYTKWALVFPFTRNDLGDKKNDFLRNFSNKIENSWHSKDKKILMIDELEKYLKEFILLH